MAIYRQRAESFSLSKGKLKKGLSAPSVKPVDVIPEREVDLSSEPVDSEAPHRPVWVIVAFSDARSPVPLGLATVAEDAQLVFPYEFLAM